MEGESAKVITISELVQRARPVTGALSVTCRRSIPPSTEPQPFDTRRNPNELIPSDQNPNPRILNALNHPTVIIGTLTLPDHDKPSNSNWTLQCPKTSCLSFTDSSSAICCDLLDLDVRIIGRRIHVLAWNFIPYKSGVGFLEIISWRLSQSVSPVSNVFPLGSGSSADSEGNHRACYSVHGELESVSPVSVVPCASSSGSRNVYGFLVQVLVCECKLCCTKDSRMGLQGEAERSNSHCFTKPLIVYFYGSASSWFPVISKLIGSVVMLSGLTKKLVSIGGEESELMYVTTDKASLHLPKLLDRWLPVRKSRTKGKGECGMYTGTITGIYMQGMVVELDKQVFLLLTDQLLALPHSLRVGAIVSVRNVHFVNPKFSWTKILVLGACFKTSISLKSFSPFETGCCTFTRPQSLLGKFINSLAFSARLWVLLLVSSFRKKFAGILPEKEILGSKHKEGLAQSYATSLLPSSVFRSRHGVLREYCKHDSCGCGNEPTRVQLKLVVPISNLIIHCEETWMKLLLEWETDSGLMYNYEKYCRVSCEGLTYSQSIRKALRSEDIGVVLLGLVKISPSSGRLQFIDATGSIDVIVPDLPSTWNTNSIYEVSDFTLVLEGIHERADCLDIPLNQPFLCRNIFSTIPFVRKINLEVCLLYHFRDTNPFQICINDEGNFEELQSGRFHLLLVAHKYPVHQKFQDEQVLSNSSSLFAEAFVLPWDLFMPGKDGYECPVKLSPAIMKESMEHHDSSRNHRDCFPIKRENIDQASISDVSYGLNTGDASRIYENCFPNKRYKMDQASSRDLSSGLSSAGHEICGHANCSSANTGSYQWRKCLNLSSPIEIPCFVTSHDQHLASSGILCCSKAEVNVHSGCKPSAEKVLLEFNSESFCKYEVLRVGCYYIIKHHKEDMLCTVEDVNDASCGKVIITSRTHLWSLLFSSDEVLPNTNLSHLPILFDSFHSNEALSESPYQNEGPLLQLNVVCPEIHSDIYVHLSTDAANFLKEDLEVSDDDVAKSNVSLKEVADISWCGQSMMTGSVQLSGQSVPELHFPEGNLISFHGHVLAVHNSDCSAFAANLRHKGPIDVPLEKFLQVTNNVCIHVLVDHHVVRISGALSKHAYPVGFGPGVYASFHRILILSGRNELILTPTSFILIKAIRVINDHYVDDKSNDLLVDSGQCHVASLDTLPSMLISEMMKCVDCKPVQFHCRVVAIYILVLEKNTKAVHPCSRFPFGPPVVNIPVAGFVLDDGSSSYCCWTNNDRAATFLRLQEDFSHQKTGTSIGGSKKILIDDACGPSSVHHIDKILTKHGRVIVKNYGSMFDSTRQDLTFSVTSDSFSRSSDEDLLKFVILNACFSTFWTVVGSRMDSNATEQLEKQLVELEMTRHPMQNIWVREVNYANPLCEARKVLQELLN